VIHTATFFTAGGFGTFRASCPAMPAFSLGPEQSVDWHHDDRGSIGRVGNRKIEDDLDAAISRQDNRPRQST